MFDLQENLVKIKDIFKKSTLLFLSYSRAEDLGKIIQIVDKLPKDPKKEDVIYSTLKIKENRNKDAIVSGEGWNLYHSDLKYESLFKKRGLFVGVQKPPGDNKK